MEPPEFNWYKISSRFKRLIPCWINRSNGTGSSSSYDKGFRAWWSCWSTYGHSGNDNDQSIAENHGGLYRGLRELRESNGESANNIFKSLGLDYRFVADGNDLETLINVFEDVKDINHPIVLHVVTQKGKGYAIAKEFHDRYDAADFLQENGVFVEQIIADVKALLS